MGAIIAAPIAAVSACAGSCAATCLCQACSGANSKECSKTAKLPYLLMAFFSVILALIMRYASGDFLAKVSVYTLDDECKNSELCLETQSAFRICFALFVFFVIMAILSAAFPSFHYTQWMIKIIIFVSLIIGMFFLPNAVFDGYVGFARVAAGLFLLMQIIVFISMAYDWNANLVERDDRRLLYAIIALSLVLFIGSAVFWGFFFSWFAQSAGGTCSLPKFFISFTIVTSVLFTLLSISNVAPHGALLTSCVVTAYNTFVLYGALSSNPSLCNVISGQQDQYQIIIGLLLGAASLTYRAASLTHSDVFGQQSVNATPEIVDVGKVNPDDPERGPAASPTIEISDENLGEIRKLNLTFHLLMALAACYFCMIITNWGSDDPTRTFNVSKEAMWVSAITIFVTTALYIWTLIAPRACPDRDFGVDLN